jgi:hypothetical protein
MLLRILYIEKDELLAGEIVKYFNPPIGISMEVIMGGLKPKFLLIHASDYNQALQVLMNYNADPLNEDPPLNTIFLDLDSESANKNLDCISFLREVQQLNAWLPKENRARLGLMFGFMATGLLSSYEKHQQELTNLGVRSFLPKPYTIEELEAFLTQYYQSIMGSQFFFLENQKPRSLADGSTIERRIIRYTTSEGKRGTIPLTPIRQAEIRGELVRIKSSEKII